MKRHIHILIILILISSCHRKSKNSIEIKGIENNDEILLDTIIPITYEYTMDTGYTYNGEVYFSYVEEMPQFGNGWEDVKKYISDNFIYPQTAIDDSIVGKVYIQFVINEDGKVSNVEVARGLRYDLEEESIRVIENMPNWKPGKQMNKFVKVMYTITLFFTFNPDSFPKSGNILTPKKEYDAKQIDFKLYPIPASDILNIKILGFESNLGYKLINTKGQIQKSDMIYNAHEQINISDLEDGVYIVQLISKINGVIGTKKIIKN